MATLYDYLSPQMSRAFLLNLENNQKFEFLFNPDTLEENYEPKYTRHSSIGLSHERMQYVGNKNTKIPLEVVFDQLVYDERDIVDSIFDEIGGGPEVRPQNVVERRRRELLELIYPRKGSSLVSASPPPVLFHWPGMINMRVRITSLKFRHRMFAAVTLMPRIMVAQIELEEEPLERIYSEDALRNGTYRPWAGSSVSRRG